MNLDQIKSKAQGLISDPFGHPVKIIVLVGIVALVLFLSSDWLMERVGVARTSKRVAQLEKQVADAEHRRDEATKIADDKAAEAARLTEQLRGVEDQLAKALQLRGVVQAESRKAKDQYEASKTFTPTSRVDRRGLCTKLGELGYPCTEPAQ